MFSSLFPGKFRIRRDAKSSKYSPKGSCNLSNFAVLTLFLRKTCGIPNQGRSVVILGKEVCAEEGMGNAVCSARTNIREAFLRHCLGIKY